MRCSFCKKTIEPGRGIMYSTKSGNISWFCSSKCERNMMMGRKARKTKWVTKKKKGTK